MKRLPGVEFNYQLIQWYMDRVKNKEYFAFPGYSDAEWFSILGIRIEHTTGLGQVLDANHGKLLSQVLIRRQHDPKWLWAMPRCLWNTPQLSHNEIDLFLVRSNIDIDEVYERDMVTDDLAEAAGLWPIVETARSVDTILIGNWDLEPVADLMGAKFVGIESPNLHMTDRGIDGAYSDAVLSTNWSANTLFLVSAGVSAAIIIDKLYDKLSNNFYFDCGSMWDAFVGIGGQRTWRAELYNNPTELEKWKHDNSNKPRN